jgi:sulfate adenylyltransferase subunit 2
LLMVDDDRLPLAPSDRVETLSVRFRTLGCYPLTGATLSAAHDLPAVISEMLAAKTSEREGRGVDKDGATSMEKRKQEGYF